MQQWIELAETKLDGSDVIIYNAPGNDDPKEVDDVPLAHGDGRVRFCRGEIKSSWPRAWGDAQHRLH